MNIMRQKSRTKKGWIKNLSNKFKELKSQYMNIEIEKNKK